jgi:predicted PurR-regulated permease PerM
MNGEEGPRVITAIEIVKAFLMICLIGAAGWFLYAIRQLLLPFILGFLFAYVLNPLVDHLEARGLRRIWAIASVYAVLLLIFAIAIYVAKPILLDQLQGLKTVSIPVYIERAKTELARLDEEVKRRLPEALHRWDLAEEVTKIAEDVGETFVKRIPSILMGVLSTLPLIALAPIISFFILKSGRSVKRSVVELAPNRYFELLLNLIYKIDQQVGGYIRGQFLDACFVAIMTTVGLKIIGLHYYIVIGVLAGLANIIPYFGYIIGIGLSSGAALLQHGHVTAVVPPIIVFVIVQLIDNNLVAPFVVARSVNLSPLSVMLAVMIGGQLFGVIGLLIAVPLTGILKVVVTTVHEGVRRYSMT